MGKVRTDNPVDIARKSLAADLVLDARHCDRELNELRDRIAEAVDASGTTLLEVYGVGPIVAALILGYAGDTTRFPTKEKVRLLQRDCSDKRRRVGGRGIG